MPIARLFRTGLFVALAASGAYMPACSSSSDSGQSEPAPTQGVLYEGDATQATLIELLSTPADSWGWAGGAFLTPPPDKPHATAAAASIASAEEPYTFSWHSDPSDVFPQAGAAGALAIEAGGGFTGMTYLLVFSTPDNARFLRVYTTNTSYTPSAAAWKQLVAVQGPITLALTTATFENSELTLEGGPHAGQELSLTIAQ